MISRPDHAFWVSIQQIVVRGLVALKFLLAARYLGAEQIGLVGVALLSLAVIEALSDTGLSQAVIQRHSAITPKEAGAVWTLQLARGIVISLALLLLAAPLAKFFEASGAAELVALAAFIPLLRNSTNPGIFLTNRDRDFQRLAVYEALPTLVDLAATWLFIRLGFGASSLLLGNIAGEAAKLFLSWVWLKISIRPTVRWREIRELTSFGKWIWGSSVITLFLNQFDKVLVAKFLGTTDFGLYQVASRIAQLAVADGATALGRYIFPTLASHYRSSPRAALDYLFWIGPRLALAAGTVAILLAVFAEAFLQAILGPSWTAAAPTLQVLALPMFIGAIIAVLVPYLRATGRPRRVTEATFGQLAVLLLVSPYLIISFGVTGAGLSLAVAGTAAVILMLAGIPLKDRKT